MQSYNPVTNIIGIAILITQALIGYSVVTPETGSIITGVLTAVLGYFTNKK